MNKQTNKQSNLLTINSTQDPRFPNLQTNNILESSSNEKQPNVKILKDKQITFPNHNPIYKGCLYFQKTDKKSDIHQIYSKIKTEVKIHQKWISEYQKSKKSLIDRAFEKLKDTINSFFEFRLEVD